MNFLQRFFKAQKIVNTEIFEGLHKYLPVGSPAWIDQNNHAYICQGFEKNADVFSVVNYITKRASTIPWKLFSMAKNGELTEIKDHPIIRLIERPNILMGQSFFIQTVLTYKLVLGNSFIWLPKLENGLRKGQTDEMWIMPAPRVEIVSGGWSKPIDHYRFSGTKEPKFRPEDVIHLRYVQLIDDGENGFYGMSPLKPGVMPLTKSNYASAAEVRAFQTMTPPGVLSRKATGTNDKTAFTTEQGSFLKKWWAEQTGLERQEIPITSAQLEFIRMGFSPVDLSILESSKLSFRQICNLYQFPAQLLNDMEAATYNNMREAKRALYEDVIIPEMHSVRDEFNRVLVPAYGENLYLDLDTTGIAVLQDDKKALAETFNLCPFISNWDKQRAMGFTEDRNFPQYTLPTSLMTLDQLNEAPEDIEEAVKRLEKLGVKEYE
jgi:HK97 family phage portal protein